MRLLDGTMTRLREFARRPATVLLLVVVPPLAIETYGTAMASFPRLPGLTGDPATVGRMTGTLFAVAFLSGLVGLFQVISARRGDARLALCGYPRLLLLGTRLGTLAVVGVLAAGIAMTTLAWRAEVADPVLAFVVLLATALLYGIIGVVVGSLLPRELEGSLVLVFMADLDNVLSSGLFDVGAIARAAPLYHPHQLFEAAVRDGTVATANVGPVLAWLGASLVVALGAYWWRGTGIPA